MEVSRRSALSLGVVASILGAAWLADRDSERRMDAGSRRSPQREGVGRVNQQTNHGRDGIPKRFTIAPDDYHVPYAGTAEDGRKFFLSNELFDFEHSYVGLFLWKADGTFDRVEVDPVERPTDVPPGQAAAAGADSLVQDKLASLGEYTLEPIQVEPFITRIHGTKFGWHTGHYKDGTAYINIEPGDFICYYAPWDGLGYDT